MIREFSHHGKTYADENLFGLNKEHCLCYQCGLFVPGTEKNCKKAQAIYELDKSLNVTTPVYECAEWVSKKVIYDGDVSDSQVNWGANDDPRGLLEPGKQYTISNEEVHSWHTKIELVEFPGKKFNSVNFQKVAI